jgi:hypothetical protein
MVLSNYYEQFFGLWYLAIIMNHYMAHICVSGLQSVQTVASTPNCIKLICGISTEFYTCTRLNYPDPILVSMLWVVESVFRWSDNEYHLHCWLSVFSRSSACCQVRRHCQHLSDLPPPPRHPTSKTAVRATPCLCPYHFHRGLGLQWSMISAGLFDCVDK